MPGLSKFAVTQLLATDTVALRDVHCRGDCRHRSEEECVSSTHLVFPYRGIFRRHVGGDHTVADANHVLFFNAGEGYQVSHPITGGDASLSLAVSEGLLAELAPASLLKQPLGNAFRYQYRAIDARTQAGVAELRHALIRKSAGTLQAESLALTLAGRCLGPRTGRSAHSTRLRRRLADRVKILLAGDLSRRWSLAEIAREIRSSPVYLTQLFQLTEGMPLYRYHLRLRLARSLDLLARCEDLSRLAADVGFSSHSHFSAAFRQAYGRTPTAFRGLRAPKQSR